MWRDLAFDPTSCGQVRASRLQGLWQIYQILKCAEIQYSAVLSFLMLYNRLQPAGCRGIVHQ